MATQNGLTEDATGDLVSCGFSTFTSGDGKTARTNVPVPGFRRFQRGVDNMHRWDGVAGYDEVPQPAVTTVHVSTPTETLRAVIDSDNSSSQAAGNAHEWVLWDGDPDSVDSAIAFKISLKNNVVTLSTPVSGGLSFGDVFIVDGSGIVIGHTVKLTISNKSELQVLGTSGKDSSVIIARFNAGSTGPSINFYKSRSGTIGTDTVVQDNDNLGQLKFIAADGASQFNTKAAIFRAEVDDPSPAAGDVGAAFVWEQMPGGGGATRETMRLDAAGLLTVTKGVRCDSLGVGVAPSGTSGEGTFTTRVVVGAVVTPAAPIHVECLGNSEGIRLMRTGVPSQYLSLSEGTFGQHLIEAFGTKFFDIKNRATSGDRGIRFYTQNNYRWQVDADGHWIAGTDNFFDYGSSGATRPRTGYFGTSLNVGDGVVVTTVNGSVAFGDGTRAFTYNAATGGIASTCDGSAATRGFIIQQSNNGAHGCQFRGNKSRGSIASPGAVVSGDYGFFLGNGFHDGAAFKQSGAITFSVDGAVSAGTVPSRIDFITTETNGGGASAFGTERLRIRADGTVDIAEGLAVGQTVGFRTPGKGAIQCNAQRAASSTALNPLLTVYESGNTYGWTLGYQTSYGLMGIYPDNQRFMLVTHANGSAPTNQASFTPRFVVLGNGKVGIGVTTPSVLLEVGGAGKYTGALEIGGDLNHDGAKSGFNAAAPVAKQDITGSRADPEIALANLLTAMATVGLIIDSTVP